MLINLYINQLSYIMHLIAYHDQSIDSAFSEHHNRNLHCIAYKANKLQPTREC
jgi:hypothetical protein